MLSSATASLGKRLGCLRGTSALSWYTKGLELEAAANPAGAIAAYERALAGRPDLADAHNNLARLHHDAGELGAAESHYRLAICSLADADAAGRALYWFNLGVVLDDRARGAEAIAAYRTAIELDASFADAYCNLACALQTAGDDESLREAMRHLSRYRVANSRG